MVQIAKDANNLPESLKEEAEWSRHPPRSQAMAAKVKRAKKKRTRRRAWTKEDNRNLKAYSKSKTAVDKIARAMKRTAGALREQALKLGIPLGHRR